MKLIGTPRGYWVNIWREQRARKHELSRLDACSPLSGKKKKNETLCPKCKSEMKIKEGRHGKFYGCIRFPVCKETKSYRGFRQ